MYTDIKILERRDDGRYVEQTESYNKFSEKCLCFTSGFTSGDNSDGMIKTSSLEFKEGSWYIMVEVSKNTGKRLMSHSFQLRKQDLKHLKEYLNNFEE